MRRAKFPILLLLGVGYLALVVPASIVLWRNVTESLPSEELHVLRLVYEQVLDDYVEERDPATLLLAATEGMVESLDGYSRFIPAEDVESFREEELEGTYQGIGVLLVANHAPITVRTPLRNGPAEAAGLLPGDRILKVGDVDVGGVSPQDALPRALELLRGEAGSSVRLTLERDGAPAPLEIDVGRGHVPQPKVRWAHVIDEERRIGYLHVHGFQRGVTEELDRALELLQQDLGGELRGLVLDLRENPGGLLTEGVAMANRFIASGPIVTLRRRGDVVLEEHTAREEQCTQPDVPLVVIVNRRSASASEVLTGALQDHHRAVVVGERTYGKGVVQTVYQWGDEPFRLKLTTSRYYTPNGRPIKPRPPRGERGGTPDWGLTPDVEMLVDDATAARLRAALGDYEVPRSFRDAERRLATDLKLEPLEPLTPGEDPQLARALLELRRLLGETVDEQPSAGGTRDR
ncbi:MAG: S41 family peptidase [Planctomycetes bacterium]|nr:S41 family peptidase [Planctomycetota bacterium]